MGIMPPYDPFRDPQLSWAVALVAACDPPTASWSAPALVSFHIEVPLRGALPASVLALFDAPREAQQSRFYVGRSLGLTPTPEALAQAAAQQAALDATPIELPPSGARVVVWFGERIVPPKEDASAPPMPPGMAPMSAPSIVPAEGAWTIPTLRLFERSTLPMRSRWIEHDSDVEREVRRRLGLKG